MAKEIWLPKSETTASVDPEGVVTVVTTMVMEAKKLQRPTAGFAEKGRDGD